MMAGPIRWGRRAVAATVEAVPFLLAGALSSAIALVVWPAVVLAGALGIAGIGWPLLPPVLRVSGWWGSRERARIAAFTDTPLPRHPAATGAATPLAGATGIDPMAKRELAWLVCHGLTGVAAGAAAVSLPVGAAVNASVPLWWWLLPADTPYSSLYPVTSWAGALGMVAVAGAYGLLALLLVPRLARWQAAGGRRLLQPGRRQLVDQLAELRASRAAALEAHSAELRRIERELHDHAQNRLVAVAVQLGIAERILDRDPAAARTQLIRAQDATDDALAGLRSVVQRIYPPVLAEHGLDGAAAALVSSCPVPCSLEVDDLRPAPAAVEAAAYLSAAEALTNTAKHSGAGEVVLRLDVRPGPGSEAGRDVLVVEVTDDGCGGAEERVGTGLAGIRHRADALGGRVELSSPAGGPTVLRVELPCGW